MDITYFEVMSDKLTLRDCKTKGNYYNIVINESTKNENIQQLHTKYILFVALGF